MSCPQPEAVRWPRVVQARRAVTRDTALMQKSLLDVPVDVTKQGSLVSQPGPAQRDPGKRLPRRQLGPTMKVRPAPGFP